jgi:hypothetical protein
VEEVRRQPFRGLGLVNMARQPTVTMDLAGLTRAERVSRAIKAMPLDATETRAVEALLAHPGATSSELSRACGWGGRIWHIHFGLLCQRRLDWLGAGYASDEDEPCFLHALLAEYEPVSGRFTMRADVEGRLRELGFGHG